MYEFYVQTETFSLNPLLDPSHVEEIVISRAGGDDLGGFVIAFVQLGTARRSDVSAHLQVFDESWASLVESRVLDVLPGLFRDGVSPSVGDVREALLGLGMLDVTEALRPAPNYAISGDEESR